MAEPARAFSQTDFTEDLKKISVPLLVMHGDDDQIVPYADSAPLSAKLLKNGTLKTYKGCIAEELSLEEGQEIRRLSDCEECGKTGRRLCDVCSGTGEVEHLSVTLKGS